MNRPDPEQLYHALLNSDRMPNLRRLSYRCMERCLLLDAVETPAGILLHQKRYKYSDAENLARSNEAGRAANTYDGNNHWRVRSYFLEQSALGFPDDAGMTLEVTCDHVLGYQMKASEFRDDWENGLAEVRVRADRTRYAL